MTNTENKNELRELITLTAEQLGLAQPFIVEKDYYVTQVLHLLSTIENPYFQLIFKGGTCLAKAHHIIQRMSEDCDYRIAPSHLAKNLTKSQFRNQLTTFRSSLMQQLNNNGFKVDKSDKEKVKIGDEGNYMKLSLPYLSQFPQSQGIRSDILLEFFVGESKTPIEKLPITTLIRETLGNKVKHPVNTVDCISIEETAAEKWVALTRRVATIQHRGEDEDTPFLIRHLYDLFMINSKSKFTDNFYNLIKIFIDFDREKFRTYNNDYYLDPVKEIKRSLDVLAKDTIWESRWNDFVNTMVFQTNQSSYKEAVKFINSLSKMALRKIKN